MAEVKEVKDMPKHRKQIQVPGLPQRWEPGFLSRVDHNLPIYRDLQDSYDEIVDDAGGEAGLTRTKKALVERFVFLEAVLRTLEHRIAEAMADNPKKTMEDLSRWIQALNSLTGLGKAIGLERVKKRVVSLQAYVKRKRQEDDE
jgi:hypothetical protein